MRVSLLINLISNPIKAKRFFVKKESEMKLIVLALCVAVVLAAPQKKTQKKTSNDAPEILTEEFNSSPEGAYKFA